MPNSDLRPDLSPSSDDPLQASAWAACLRWACGNPEVIDRYRAETGDTYWPKLTTEAQADDLAYAERFVGWFNANIWGDFTSELSPGD